MPSPDELTADACNRYFTEQVIGGPVTVELGPADTARQVSDRSATLDALSGRLHRLGAAARSLHWRNTPAALAAGPGAPLPLSSLAPLRRAWLAAALLAWSVALGTGLWALFNWMHHP